MINSHRSGLAAGRFLFGMALGAAVLLLVNAGIVNAFDTQSAGGLIREWRIGLAAHDVDGLWSGSAKEEGLDLCAEAVFNRPLFSVLYATAYPNAGVSINTRGYTSKVYGGFRMQWQPATAFTFSTGLGLALHNGKRDTEQPDRKALGSPVLFRIPIEFGWVIDAHYRIVLAFDHISNAYLFSPNEGLDTLGLMVGYRF